MACMSHPHPWRSLSSEHTHPCSVLPTLCWLVRTLSIPPRQSRCTVELAAARLLSCSTLPPPWLPTTMTRFSTPSSSQLLH